MALEELTQLEILQGSTSLIYAIAGTIVGALIASKYYKHKKPELLGIGISLILLTTPWYGGGISFLTLIFFGFILEDSVYFFINYGLVAFALIAWIYGIALLIFPQMVKKLVVIFSIICIIFEIALLITLSTDITMVGTKEGKFNSNAALLPSIFIIFSLIVTLISMLMFIRVCLRSENLKIKWQGKFLLIAILLMIVGSLMDAVITMTPITLIIARIILMIRLFFSYLGWLMPERIAKRLIKQE